MTRLKHSNFQNGIWRSSSVVVSRSVYSKKLGLYEKIFKQRSHSSSQMHKISPYIIIKASIKPIPVTLLLVLKFCLPVEIKFWKAPLRTTFKNLWSFQGKYLGWRSVLVKLLSLRFTVILLMILKLMVLQNHIMILWTLSGIFFPVIIFLLTFHSIYCST